MKDTILDLLRRSLEDRFSVVVFLPKETIGLVVTKIDQAGTVVGYNQYFDEVQIRVDQIQAIARA